MGHTLLTEIVCTRGVAKCGTFKNKILRYENKRDVIIKHVDIDDN